MLITAKFASNCPNCGVHMPEGSEVEWVKGEKARHRVCPRPSLRLIGGSPAPSTGMNTNAAAPSLEESVAKISAFAHVVEVKAPYALVHASPAGLAKIVAEGFSVHPSKRGGDYYAIRIAKGANLGLVPPQVNVAPSAPRPVPAAARAPQAPVEPGLVRMVLKGADYLARETRVKRTNMDVRRFEVRKDGELVQEPYVVSFQSEDGSQAQCSCPDWIYRRRQCKHIQGCQAVFARARQTELAIAN